VTSPVQWRHSASATCRLCLTSLHLYLEVGSCRCPCALKHQTRSNPAQCRKESSLHGREVRHKSLTMPKEGRSKELSGPQRLKLRQQPIHRQTPAHMRKKNFEQIAMWILQIVSQQLVRIEKEQRQKERVRNNQGDLVARQTPVPHLLPISPFRKQWRRLL
jgi:hypothetical protein